MAGTGEERDRRRLAPHKIGKARHAEGLSDPQDHGEFGHLEPSPLHLLYPARRLAQQTSENGPAHTAAHAENLHSLAKRDRLVRQFRSCVR